MEASLARLVGGFPLSHGPRGPCQSSYKQTFTSSPNLGLYWFYGTLWLFPFVCFLQILNGSQLCYLGITFSSHIMWTLECSHSSAVHTEYRGNVDLKFREMNIQKLAGSSRGSSCFSCNTVSTNRTSLNWFHGMVGMILKI